MVQKRTVPQELHKKPFNTRYCSDSEAIIKIFPQSSFKLRGTRFAPKATARCATGCMLSRELGSDPPITVLLVDDHQDIRTLTGMFLRQAGFHVEAVDSGEAAIDFLQKANAQVVITDLRMSGKCDGFAVLAYHNHVCPEGGRILFTADCSEKLRVDCQQINALYVPKHVRPTDLLLKIKDCLAAHSSLATNRANTPGSLMKKESPQRGALFTKPKEMSWRSYFVRKAGR